MRALLFGAAALAALGLAGCGKTSAVVGSSGPTASTGPTTGYASVQQAATPLVDGKPMWAANRRHSAQENAQYQFARNGGEFGAASERDYVLKVHAFVEKPPADAQSVQRDNGDTLIYAPGVNTFAVVSRDGAPRTMFKPRDGAAYWTRQKAALAGPRGDAGAPG